MLRSLFGRPRAARVPAGQRSTDVQTVNLRRQPSLIITRFLLAGAITGVVFQAIKYVDPQGDIQKRDVSRGQLDQARKDGFTGRTNSQYGKHWDQQHANMQPAEPPGSAKPVNGLDGICLTLPIWMQKATPRPYADTEPEFREYVKLQADAKRMKEVKFHVLYSVAHAAQKSKRLRQEMELITYIGSIMETLDLVPQLFPPPLYLLPCVWIPTKFQGVEFGWRAMGPDMGARVERIFRPMIVFDACHAATSIFFRTAYAITKARVNKTLGIGTEGAAAGVPPQIAMPQVPPKVEPDLKLSGSRKGRFDTLLPVRSSVPDTISSEPLARQMHQDMVSAMPYSLAVRQAKATFNHVKSTQQEMIDPRNIRGICLVRGSLFFNGQRGKMRFEVRAFYLPSQDKFIGGVEILDSELIIDYSFVAKENEQWANLQKLKTQRAREQLQQRQQKQQAKKDEMAKAFEQQKEKQKSEDSEKSKTASETVLSEEEKNKRSGGGGGGDDDDDNNNNNNNNNE